jgi:hypothetical protein
MAALTAARPRRLTALERMAMTPEQELERLVAEQEADDTHYQITSGTAYEWQVSLDALAPTGDGGTIGAELVGRDPWDLVDACIDIGLDPAEVAYSGDISHTLPRRRGLLAGGGLIDPTQIPHATAGGYQNHKCRCRPCKTAWATYSRERRAARRAS